jgi:hypothetical protein
LPITQALKLNVAAKEPEQMKRLVLFVCLSIAAPALAQDAETCRLPQISLFGYCLPVRKVSFDKNVENTTLLNPQCPLTLTGVYFGQPGRSGTPVSVHFVNASEKRMIAVKLGLTGFDATRDSHDFAEPYALAVNLKPERKAEPVWRVPDPDFEVDTASGARVYLTKVVYANGATWEDDGSRSCSLTVRGVAKPKSEDN